MKGLSMLKRTIAFIKSWWLSRSVDNVMTPSTLPIYVPYRNQKVIIKKHKTANLIINGQLVFHTMKDFLPALTMITLNPGSTLIVNGKFHIGNGSEIIVNKGATLTLNGDREITGSGMTAAVKVLVYEKITIGYDCLISWGVTIMDSDSHTLLGSNPTKQVNIGNQVWIGCNSTILKGSDIGHGAVIGAGAIVAKAIPAAALAAGNPARVIREAIKWSK